MKKHALLIGLVLVGCSASGTGGGIYNTGSETKGGNICPALRKGSYIEHLTLRSGTSLCPKSADRTMTIGDEASLSKTDASAEEPSKGTIRNPDGTSCTYAGSMADDCLISIEIVCEVEPGVTRSEAVSYRCTETSCTGTIGMTIKENGRSLCVALYDAVVTRQ